MTRPCRRRPAPAAEAAAPLLLLAAIGVGGWHLDVWVAAGARRRRTGRTCPPRARSVRLLRGGPAAVLGPGAPTRRSPRVLTALAAAETLAVVVAVAVLLTRGGRVGRPAPVAAGPPASCGDLTGRRRGGSARPGYAPGRPPTTSTRPEHGHPAAARSPGGTCGCPGRTSPWSSWGRGRTRPAPSPCPPCSPHPGWSIATSNKADLWALTSGLRGRAGPVWTFDPQAIAHAAADLVVGPAAGDPRRRPDDHRFEAAARLAGALHGHHRRQPARPVLPRRRRTGPHRHPARRRPLRRHHARRPRLAAVRAPRRHHRPRPGRRRHRGRRPRSQPRRRRRHHQGHLPDRPHRHQSPHLRTHPALDHPTRHLAHPPPTRPTAPDESGAGPRGDAARRRRAAAAPPSTCCPRKAPAPPPRSSPPWSTASSRSPNSPPRPPAAASTRPWSPSSTRPRTSAPSARCPSSTATTAPAASRSSPCCRATSRASASGATRACTPSGPPPPSSSSAPASTTTRSCSRLSGLIGDHDVEKHLHQPRPRPRPEPAVLHHPRTGAARLRPARAAPHPRGPARHRPPRRARRAAALVPRTRRRRHHRLRRHRPDRAPRRRPRRPRPRQPHRSTTAPARGTRP